MNYHTILLHLVRFPGVRYWYGMPEESLVRDAEYMDLEKNFQIVHTSMMERSHLQDIL